MKFLLFAFPGVVLSFRSEAHADMELLYSCDETPLLSLLLEVLRRSLQLNNVSLLLSGSS